MRIVGPLRGSDSDLPIDLGAALAARELCIAEVVVRHELDATGRAWAVPESHGYNAYGTVVADGRRPISDPAFQVQAIAAGGAERVIALAPADRMTDGRVEHPLWLIDARGGIERVLCPGEVISLDVSADGRTVAVLQWADGHAVLSKVDVASGRLSEVRSFEQSVDSFAGNERVRFAADGVRMLMVLNPGRALIVEHRTGETATTDLAGAGGATWWPGHGADALLTWTWGDDGITTLGTFDLATRERSRLGVVRLPDVPPVDPDRRIVFDIDPAPAGEAFVCVTFLGPDDAHQTTHGSRERRALGRFVSGVPGVAAELVEVAPHFLDNNPALEWRHRSHGWTRAPRSAPVSA